MRKTDRSFFYSQELTSPPLPLLGVRTGRSLQPSAALHPFLYCLLLHFLPGRSLELSVAAALCCVLASSTPTSSFSFALKRNKRLTSTSTSS